MTMKWNNKKSTRIVWTTLVVTIFALCILLVFAMLNLGTNRSLISQGSHESIPHSEKLTEEECIPVCGSEGCILEAKMLLDFLQPALNPCDNFYKFTCGSLADKFPDDGGAWVIRLNKQIRIKFRNILENLEPSPNSASDKMKIVYDSCINSDSEIEAIPTLKQILDKFGLKDWPYLTSDFMFENTTFTNVIANLLLHEEYGFVTLEREDQRVQSEIPYFLEVTSGSLIEPQEALQIPSDEVRKLQIDRVLKYFNLNPETVVKIQEEREAMHREIERLKMEGEIVSESSTHEDTYVDCSGAIENEWSDLCEIINLFLDVAKVNEEVSSKHVSIASRDVYYVRNIFPLLRNFSDRAVANYLAIEVILKHMNDLNVYFRLTYQKGTKDALKFFGLVRPIDRGQSCVDWISNSMPYALMYEYGKKEFTVNMLNEITNLTYELIHEAAEYYSKQEWMPETIRKKETEEVRNYKLGSPSMKIYPTDTAVNEFYNEFKPKKGNFLNNVMEFRKFKTVEKMRNKIETLIFEDKIFTADAYGGGGSIDIGLTLPQPPYFSIKTQRIFNLVSLGFTIVHEIGHSMFDHRDFQLDHYQRNVKCITDQVSQYQFELIGKNLNGQHYIHEDLADNVAASIIDKIIEKYLSEGGESFLPGLPFSAKQLLYIKNALIFCSVTSKRKEELYSQYNRPPDNTRIYQRGRNSKMFSEAFDCPVGSFMNPADKCRMLTDARPS